MMRNNVLLSKWTSLGKNSGSNNKTGGGTGKNWQHPPDTLINGHIAYLVKFLGVTETEHPKGIDVVKDCIRKLKLDEEIRRAEGCKKTPKAELTVSVDGLGVQDPKTKQILHSYPLHQISYCADDKTEKKFFSFIAKDGDTHRCFVFASEKLAEEIILTIGQAFELAYKRYLDSSGRELELKKEVLALQEKITKLETENESLKKQLALHNGDSSSIQNNNNNYQTDLLLIADDGPTVVKNNESHETGLIFKEFAMTASEILATQQKPELDLLMSEPETSNNRGAPDGIEAPIAPRISPPPIPQRQTQIQSKGNELKGQDPFGSDPFFTDPFGMSDFSKNLPTS